MSSTRCIVIGIADVNMDLHQLHDRAYFCIAIVSSINTGACISVHVYAIVVLHTINIQYSLT